MKIGVVGPLGDQAVQNHQRVVQKTLLEAGDGMGIARRQAVILLGEEVIDFTGSTQKPRELGPHALMTFHDVGRDRGPGIGGGSDRLLQEGDTVRRQRVGAQVGVLLRGQQNFLVLENAEEVEQSFRALVGPPQVVHGGLVGGLLLPPREGQ